MRYDRGSQTNPGQERLDQAQGMEWEGRHMKHLGWEREGQKDGFAKKMPRDHGPEVVSEVAELDLALLLRGLAESRGWRDLDGGRFDGRVSVLTLDAYAGSTTVIALECLC